jgi:hypothetical protein
MFIEALRNPARKPVNPNFLVETSLAEIVLIADK